MGAALHVYGWTHRADLTLASSASTKTCKRYFESWVRGIASRCQRPCYWFLAVERGALFRRRHMHALIATDPSIPTTSLETAWRHGLSWVRKYSSERQARYVVKDFFDEEFDYDFSSNFRKWAERERRMSAKSQGRTTNGGQRETPTHRWKRP